MPRWTYTAMLDSDPGLSAAERDAVERRMQEHAARQRGYKTILSVALTITILGVILVGPLAGRALVEAGLPKLPAQILGIGGVALLGLVGYLALCWHVHVRPLRQAMRDFGHDVCLDCGHSLEGLDEKTSRCPECGSGRAAHVLPRRAQR
ncbi:MAG: hypothetical protein ACYTGP_01240 [Planctomycetota bacterium]|jgi:hypothetical protein